jgi:hypothetical protein
MAPLPSSDKNYEHKPTMLLQIGDTGWLKKINHTWQISYLYFFLPDDGSRSKYRNVGFKENQVSSHELQNRNFLHIVFLDRAHTENR